MTERELIGTGQQQFVPGNNVPNKIPDFDERSGDHFFVVNLSYSVDPTLWADDTHTPIFDLENLVLVSPAICWHCEELFSPQLAKRRCRGHGK